MKFECYDGFVTYDEHVYEFREWYAMFWGKKIIENIYFYDENNNLITPEEKFNCAYDCIYWILWAYGECSCFEIKVDFSSEIKNFIKTGVLCNDICRPAGLYKWDEVKRNWIKINKKAI